MSETSGGSDTSTPVDETSVVEDSGTEVFTPDVAAEAPAGGGCFATSGATVDTCKTACKTFDMCSFSFGSCESGCTTRTAIMEKCAKGNTTCNGFEACVKCSLICEQADTCPGMLSAATCCGNCVNRPECFDSTLPVCDAIKKSDVSCPPKMM
ncbi:MAG: hypothetical protein ACXWUG_06115 [Polyangiales bacterium]